MSSASSTAAVLLRHTDTHTHTSTHTNTHTHKRTHTQTHTQVVCVMFDEPVTLSLLKVWNYAKTPGRGVRDFHLCIDDVRFYIPPLPLPPP